MTRSQTEDEAVALLPDKKPHPSSRQHSDGATLAVDARPYLVMLLSAFFNATMTTLSHVAESEHGLSANAVMALGTAVTLTFSVAIIANQRLFHLFRLTKSEFALLGVRGAFAAVSAALVYEALARTDPGTAITIFFTSPTLTSLMCAVFLDEPFTPWLGFALALNIFGVVLVTRPLASHGEDVAREFVGAAMAFAGALTGAAGFVVVKRMGSRIHFAQNMLSYGLGCAVLCALRLTSEDVSHISTRRNASIIALLAGCAGFVSKSALNHALPLCPSGSGLIVRSMSVPITYVMSAFIIGTTVSLIGVCGSLAVMLSVVSVMRGRQ